ncbi:recombinase family protein [Sphingomonas carotinifaciens]|uniref:Resolvase n=1 Tax=Sphingomonas carotinifaciens TaxID=1166323 RepID=A0A1G7RSB1_9SPHN|nr:recombinase family protein [Sphingomonas carotinifaciens]MBB4088120.1 DNA invertase Pin-like site-specific DNA recombinase [Sphingomonas carotinifaciens]MWC43825.1 resolvase [Sphingomonas carotinifaciens]SDG13691.1 Site-specific DNA recombinase [Sphingomonas carotinifaciens]
MFVRAYLRASTAEQDATRARAALDAFAASHGFRIAARYVEHESGTRLARPELFRLLDDCGPGDVLLVEQVDRLSRLSSADWSKLRSEIEARQVRIVSLDLPTSWNLIATPDDFTSRMFAAVNAMMLDVLAAVARKDYDDRRRRQAEGVSRARTAGLYKGRVENTARNAAIARSLKDGQSWREIMMGTGCSRTLLAKIARRLKTERMADASASDPSAVEDVA